MTLVGLSMAGGVAMQIALDRPDLVDCLVPIGSYGLAALPNGLLSYALARCKPSMHSRLRCSGAAEDSRA